MTDETSTIETEIWGRLIKLDIGDLSPAAAREWLRLQISDTDVARVRELSHKANCGELTSCQEKELDSYRFRLLVLQSLQRAQHRSDRSFLR